jgi:hypothetical protein
MKGISRYSTGLLVAFFAAILIWYVSGPSFDEYLSVVRSAAGPAARDCGLVQRREAASTAISCASESLAQQQPFFVVLERGGIDTRTFAAVVATDRRQLLRIVWKDDILGLPLLPWPRGFISKFDCELAPSNAIAECVMYRIDD